MTSNTFAITGTLSGLANNQQGNIISENLAKMVQGGTAPTPTSTGFSSLSGVWWHDTTNNQVKVRDQADTTWIVVGTIDETTKLFTAAATGIAAIKGSFSKLKVDTRSGSVVVTADEVVLESSSNTYSVIRALSATIGTGSVGANGLDTGTFQPNTWYAIHAIYNGTTKAGLLSTSASAPAMPSGYTYSAHMGWVRSNATPALLPTLQVGRRAQYVVDGTILTQMPSIASGSTSSAWSARAWASFVPPAAALIYLSLYNRSGTSLSSGLAPNASFDSPGASSTNNLPPIGFSAGGTDSKATIQGSFALENATNIWYWANNSSCGALVNGWEDNL